MYLDKITEIKGTMIGIPAFPPPPGISDTQKNRIALFLFPRKTLKNILLTYTIQLINFP